MKLTQKKKEKLLRRFVEELQSCIFSDMSLLEITEMLHDMSPKERKNLISQVGASHLQKSKGKSSKFK